MSVACPWKPPDTWWIRILAVRQRHALSLRARREQQRAHAHRDADADRLHVGLDELHRVVDREAGVHRAARRVDVDRDVLVGVLGLEVEELGDDEVRDLVVDRRAEEDDALVEQARVDVERALSARGLLDHHRDQRAHAQAPCFRGSRVSFRGAASPFRASRASRARWRGRPGSASPRRPRGRAPSAGAGPRAAARADRSRSTLSTTSSASSPSASACSRMNARSSSSSTSRPSLVGDRLEHELPCDRLRGLRAQPLLELLRASGSSLRGRSPARSRGARASGRGRRGARAVRASTSGPDGSTFEASTSASAAAARNCVSTSSSICSRSGSRCRRAARQACRTRSPPAPARRRAAAGPSP